MSLAEMSVMYNLIFILILVIVCALFSFIHLWIRNRLKINYWLLTTGLFVSVTFITITLWYFVIGFVFY